MAWREVRRAVPVDESAARKVGWRLPPTQLID
jgi:hypothetical protein